MTREGGSQKSNDLSSKAHLTLLMLGCIGFAALVLFRSACIQLLSDSRLESMARRQFETHSLIRPRRGSILDRNGELLAVNVEANSLAANPLKIENKHKVARLLAKATNIPTGKILQKLQEKREFVWIKRHISNNELLRFKKYRIIDSEGDWLEGLWLVKESDRVYPHRQLASQILGGVNVDSEGIEGIELWMNDLLRGKVVSVTAIKDALGRPTFIDAVAAQNIQDGEPITLTLDAPLQFQVEQELSHAVQKTGSKSGTVIVMNAVNGEILAMANEPTFNPNEKGSPANHRRNRALTDGYEPGSTLKAVLIASALSNGWKLTDQVWAERGSFMIQGHRISEAESQEQFEWLSLKKLIQVSSNVAAAKVALKLGADHYLRTLHAFGFGTKTGVGFPGEISGYLPPRKEWRPITLANIGFGQGILVTPLQMTRAYSVLLNGGWLVQPTLFKTPHPRSSSTPSPPSRILSSRVTNEVIEALKSVTQEGGTGTQAALPGYEVAGKTGTAQEVDMNTGKYSREKYIASFIGFPVGIDPKLVIFTSLVEPHGAYYAAETAVPLFRQVLNSVVNRYGLPVHSIYPPPKLLGENSSPSSDTLNISQAAPANPDDGLMPSLIGLTPREAMRVLKGHRFKLEMTGIGVISGQTPDPGKKVAEGGKIRLILTEP